jgi:hypothetical protein
MGSDGKTHGLEKANMEEGHIICKHVATTPTVDQPGNAGAHGVHDAHKDPAITCVKDLRRGAEAKKKDLSSW